MNHLPDDEFQELISRYVPALYDPSSSTMHIYPSAPLYLLSHRAKRTKQLAADPSKSTQEWREKRNNLGDAFGTKKAKSAIRAEERNKLDAGGMQSVKGHLMESIGEREAVAADGE